jgi:hypothetical protein
LILTIQHFFFQVGEDLRAIVKNNKIVQPFLIHIGESFYLVVDKTAIHLPNKFDKAFDIFFKSFFVFNVRYPLLLTNFFNFLEVFIYKIKKRASSKSLEMFNKIDMKHQEEDQEEEQEEH